MGSPSADRVSLAGTGLSVTAPIGHRLVAPYCLSIGGAMTHYFEFDLQTAARATDNGFLVVVFDDLASLKPAFQQGLNEAAMMGEIQSLTANGWLVDTAQLSVPRRDTPGFMVTLHAANGTSIWKEAYLQLPDRRFVEVVGQRSEPILTEADKSAEQAAFEVLVSGLNEDGDKPVPGATPSPCE